MANANTWIKKLKLLPHPEGGYYRELYRSKEIITKDALPTRYNASRNFATSIYYLLKGKQFSAWHKIKSDEIWHHYDGCAITIHTVRDNRIYQKLVLGKNVENGEIPQVVIPYSVWFAAELNDKSSFSLIGCSVAPGFDFNDFELGVEDELIQQFPDHKDLIKKFSHKQPRIK